jgi:LAO/AO transport system kinase
MKINEKPIFVPTNRHYSLDQSYINLNLKRAPRTQRSVDEYVHGILTNQRPIISECITLIESKLADKRDLGMEVLARLPVPTSSLRIGITGTPGVGKSTFIEALGLDLLRQGKKVAVLTIDPSSIVSQGSIMGDKMRMDALSTHPLAYVRPTPSSNTLGGIAAHTYETISICEAATYDYILIETVGVGQSEIDVDNLVDINILLLQPGAGDDMQGIKRGILEKADIIIVHKADGVQLDLARKTQQTYKQTLQLFKRSMPKWICPVILFSSITLDGFSDLRSAMDGFLSMSKQCGHFEQKRTTQTHHYIKTTADQIIHTLISANSEIRDTIDQQLQSQTSIYQRMIDLQKNLTTILQKSEKR